MAGQHAVVCATHPLPNPGMTAVDAAMDAFRRRHGLGGEFVYYRLYTPEERNPETSPERRARFRSLAAGAVEYRSLRDEPGCLRNADSVIYWGDFLHSRDFLVQTAAVLTRIGAVATHQEAVNFLLNTLFLSNLSEPTDQKVVLFGGTLLFNTSRDYADGAYASVLSSLLQRATGVWMRDLVSASAAARLAGRRAKVRFGTDAALLLRHEDLDLLPRGNEWYDRGEQAGNTAGVFFGRSAVAVTAAALLADALCRGMGVQAEWIPWFDATLVGDRLQVSRDALNGLREPPPRAVPTTGDLLDRVGKYRFVVTDTYHLCVNAWNLGVPAVCIGESFPDVPYDVSAGWYGSWRDKRQEFYSLNDALELYTTLEELSDQGRFDRRRYVVLEALRDEGLTAGVVHRIRARAEEAEGELLAALCPPSVAPKE